MSKKLIQNKGLNLDEQNTTDKPKMFCILMLDVSFCPKGDQATLCDIKFDS